MKSFFVICVLLSVLALGSVSAQAAKKQAKAKQAPPAKAPVAKAAEEKPAVEPAAAGEEDPAASEEEVTYAKNSLCGYCDYCKFCTMCEKDCPCETSPTKPNCKMCKYCKYCYLCSAVCDTVCQPGGFVDRISSSIISSLPYHDREEIDKDLDSVKSWIDKNKDEL